MQLKKQSFPLNKSITSHWASNGNVVTYGALCFSPGHFICNSKCKPVFLQKSWVSLLTFDVVLAYLHWSKTGTVLWIVNIKLATSPWESNVLGSSSPAGLSGARPAPLLYHHQTKVLIARAYSTALVKLHHGKPSLYLAHTHACAYTHACT